MDLKRKDKRIFESASAPVKNRFLKELFGAANNLRPEFGDKDLAECLQEQINFHFNIPDGLPYTIDFSSTYIMYENERVIIEYLHGESLEERSINIKEKKNVRIFLQPFFERRVYPWTYGCRS